MRGHNLRRILGNEYIFSIVTKFISLAIGILHSVLVARYLGAELKGVNAYIASVVGVGSIIITFGMHQAYPYLRKEYGKDTIYEDYVGMIEFLYIVLLSFAGFLAFCLPLSIETKAIVILTPLYGYTRISGYVVLIESPNRYNKWETILTVFSLVYIIVLWFATSHNMFWAISILAILEIGRAIIYTISLKVKPYISKKQLPIFKELLKYGFFPMVALLMTTLNYKIDTLMLKNSQNITNAMVGVYSVGITLSDKIALIPDTLKGVIVSKLSKGAGADEVAKVSRLCFLCSLCICIGTIIFGKPFIDILYGKEYAEAYTIIVITAAGAVAIGYFKLIAQYNIVNKKQFLNVIMLSIAVIIDIVLNIAFIPIWGINGAAIATCIGNIVCGIVFVIWFCRKNNMKLTQMICIQKTDLQMIKRVLNLKHKRKRL